MRKRFSLGSKTVEVNFVKPQSNLDCKVSANSSSQEITCDCSWTGAVEALEQKVHPRRVDLQCPSCSETLAEVVYTPLSSKGNDARLPTNLSSSDLEDSGRTHLDESSSRRYLQ